MTDVSSATVMKEDVEFELINRKPVKELLLLFRVTAAMMRKMRGEIVMVMMSASVEGIPLSLSTSLSAGRRGRYEKAGL